MHWEYVIGSVMVIVGLYGLGVYLRILPIHFKNTKKQKHKKSDIEKPS